MRKICLTQKLLVCLLAAVITAASACSGKAGQIKEMMETAQQYVLDGNYEEAIAAFNKAIEIDPKQPDAYHGLFDLYRNRGDYKNARETVLRGIEGTGADVENSKITYKDAIEGLEGKDLLIHDYFVIEKIMTNPLRIITKEGDKVYQADYEYEFDLNGRITLLRVKTEDGTEETRYTYNEAGIVSWMSRSDIVNYSLRKTGAGYEASYISDSEAGPSNTVITYDENGKELERKVTSQNQEGEETTIRTSFTYDDEGRIVSSTTAGGGLNTITSYEKNYPTKIDHGMTVMNAEGKLFDIEQYKNTFDAYDRIEQIDITCLNTQTSESFLWQTTNYYYYDTLEG